MVERPILINGAMVRAILDGRKTQTRRAIKDIPWRQGVNPDFSEAAAFSNAGEFRIAGSAEMTTGFRCPFGQPGDRLWVRETWMPGYYHEADHEDGPRVSLIYAADNAESAVPAPSYELAEKWEREFCEDGDEPPPWRPSIHMPRWACRLVLEITRVRVARLHWISEPDALAEGINRYQFYPDEGFPLCDGYTHLPDDGRCALDPTARGAFQKLWTSTGGDWDGNPWVWAIGFKRVEAANG